MRARYLARKRREYPPPGSFWQFKHLVSFSRKIGDYWEGLKMPVQKGRYLGGGGETHHKNLASQLPNLLVVLLHLSEMRPTRHSAQVA
jgi:hypothetical protein